MIRGNRVGYWQCGNLSSRVAALFLKEGLLFCPDCSFVLMIWPHVARSFQFYKNSCLMRFFFGNTLNSVHGKQIIFFRGNTSQGIYYICFSIMCRCRREDWANVMMREGQLSVACALCSQFCRVWDSSHQFPLKGKHGDSGPH